MIIDFSLSYRDYASVTDHCMQHRYKCSLCDSTETLIRYGHYVRSLVVWEENHLADVTIRIQRLLCRSCGHSHAIIPYEMIPFWQYSLRAVFVLLSAAGCGRYPNSKKKPIPVYVSWQLLYRFLSIYEKYRSRLEMLINQKSSFMTGNKQEIRDTFFDETAFPQEAYFREHQEPLFLNRRSTEAFPFFCSASF